MTFSTRRVLVLSNGGARQGQNPFVKHQIANTIAAQKQSLVTFSTSRRVQSGVGAC